MATKAITRSTRSTKAVSPAPATDVVVLERSLDDLTATFTEARETFAHQSSVMEAAKQARDIAAVWMARSSYLTSIHPDMNGGKHGKQNISAAAKHLGMPYGTLRPYVLAGGALAKLDRVGVLGTPDAADVEAVRASIEATANARRRELNAKAKAKLEADKARLAALEAANAVKGAPAPAGAGAPADAPAAPVAAPVAAPAPVVAGPTLADDTLATARLLVKQVAALRKSGEWKTVGSKVVSILGQAFPVLGK